jgi:Uma2 family endonuclease
MSITINPPPGPWTVADLDRVPDSGFRVEIHEGNLVIMSPATLWHSDVARRICNALLAAGRSAANEVGVKRSDRSTRVADVAVFQTRPADTHQAFWTPDRLELVVEVVSESSEDDDRITKPRWYAAAGIPEYWRVEETVEGDDAVIFRYDLARTADGTPAYVERGVTTLSALESPAS